MIKIIKKDFPNFPNEIINDWLLPYAKNIGWPPTNKRWENIFFGKSLQFWQSITWEQQNLNLSKIIFSSKTIEIFEDLKDAYFNNIENIYSRSNPSGKSRYQNALKYIIQQGQFPKPICVLLENDQYSIVDGNHRFIAWWVSCQLINEMNSKKNTGSQNEIIDKFKKLLAEKMQVRSIAPIFINHKIWVGTKKLQVCL
jgi:hypothetical protein